MHRQNPNGNRNAAELGYDDCVLNHYAFNSSAATGLTKVLLVDDDPNILRPLQLLMGREGYRVLTAGDGEAALAVTTIESPDLIVTDWMMPRVDGVELCRRLKDDTATADIPVVMLSAALPPDPKEPLWDILLLKPVAIGRLIKEVRCLLDERLPTDSGANSSDGTAKD